MRLQPRSNEKSQNDGYMGVHDRREWRDVAGEPLRQEQVVAGPVDRRDSRVARAVERVQPVEPYVIAARSRARLIALGTG